MRITDVQAFLLSSPMPEPIRLTYYGGERTIFKRDAALVRISTNGGLVGYGPAVASERAAAHINGVIRDALIGEEIGNGTASVPYHHGVGNGRRAVPNLRAKVLTGASSEIALAFGGVEIALYDLRGKMEGCPVHALLGGKVRDHVRLYGSAGMYQTPEGYAAEAMAVAALGFTAYKMRPALGPEDDLKTVRLIREAVGPDVGIMVDAHAWWRMGDRSYTPALVEQLAREMARYNITWLEEPLPPHDRATYVRLREAGIVPVAAGEHETSLDGFMEIITKGAVDVAQADVTHQGGYTSVKRVIQTCAEHGRLFAFHNWGTLLECIAMAHLGVCFPVAVCAWLEYPCFSHRAAGNGTAGNGTASVPYGAKVGNGRRAVPIMYPFPLADDILKEPLQIENGDLLIPDGAGLGVEVDELVIDRYPYIPGPWSVFRLTSPPEEWAISGDHTAEWEEKG